MIKTTEVNLSDKDMKELTDAIKNHETHYRIILYGNVDDEEVWVSISPVQSLLIIEKDEVE